MIYVYIIESINRETLKSIFYTGVTNDMARRYNQHMNQIKSGFMTKWHKNDTKKLVYIEEINDYYKAGRREKQIKAYSSKRKSELINSDKNRLASIKVNFGRVEKIYLKNPFLVIFRQ